MNTDLLFTVTGNIGTDPEHKLIGEDQQHAMRFRLAYTPRVKNRSGDWVDGETTWYTIEAWGHLAVHAAARLAKGHRVTVTSARPPKVRAWPDDNGEIRADTTITACDIGLSMIFDQSTV